MNNSFQNNRIITWWSNYDIITSYAPVRSTGLIGGGVDFGSATVGQLGICSKFDPSQPWSLWRTQLWFRVISFYAHGGIDSGVVERWREKGRWCLNTCLNMQRKHETWISNCRETFRPPPQLRQHGWRRNFSIMLSGSFFSPFFFLFFALLLFCFG